MHHFLLFSYVRPANHLIKMAVGLYQEMRLDKTDTDYNRIRD